MTYPSINVHNYVTCISGTVAITTTPITAPTKPPATTAHGNHILQ